MRYFLLTLSKFGRIMNNTSPITTEATSIVCELYFIRRQQEILNEARIVAHISKGEGLTPEEKKVISLAQKVAELTKNAQHRLNSASEAVKQRVGALSAFQVVKPA